jgi:glycosyltransferase involved in cell wall biosynthesis
MRVLLLAPVPPPDHGGIINWTRIVKTEFARRPAFELRFVDSAVRYRDVTDFSVLRRMVFGSAQALRDCIRVFYQFRSFRPDIFHLCTSGGPATLKDAMLVALARQFKIPVAVHYRMGRLPQIIDTQNTERWLIRYVLKASSAVLVLGSASEDVVRAVAPDQYVVNLPNMVDMNEMDSARIISLQKMETKKSWKISFVGHVIPTKGIEELVRACAAMYEENLELHLVGPCGETFHDVLVNAAHEGSGNGRWLKFYGPVNHSEALEHIAQCDLFVLPSHSEGAPNVILEAMGMGKPILSTFVGAVPEMLAVDSDKPCGVCVAPKCADSIQKAIQDFLGDSLKWHQFTSNARNRAARLYASPVICDQLTDLWYDLSLKQKRLSLMDRKI